MREIKFRVWFADDATKPSMYHFDLENYNGFNIPFIVKNSEPLMQFTGLKDKNGVEIYEGDIVAMEGSTEQGLYGEVVWFNDNSCFGWFSRRFPDDMLRGFANKNRIEVIGNIWENPELLEQL